MHSLFTSTRRAAVIGAGPSGLATARWLLAEGIEPSVFEQSADLGGIWKYHEEPADGGPAYRSLRTNTSKHTMAFSDFPFPDALPDFPERAAVMQYLHDYAAHFALTEHIHFNTRVESATPTSTGQWQLRTRTATHSDTQTFGALVVCSGRDSEPHIPCYPGQEIFHGTVLHSARYRTAEPFAAQQVVVVGTGSSAADIAVELSKVAGSVLLSTARGAWFLPRHIRNRPWDHQLTRLGARVPYRLRMRILRALVLSEYARLGVTDQLRHARWPLPEFDIWKERFTPSSEILVQIANGQIGVKPGILRFEEHEIVFADDTRANADVVLFCTGYNTRFPFFDPAQLTSEGNDIPLYKHVFPPDLPKLAFVGMVVVGGPLLPIAELQARCAARVFRGAVNLPPPDQMRASTEQQRARQRRLTPYTQRVQLPDYADELAGIIGARPRLMRHPRILAKLLLGPLLAAQYRLDGPNAMPQAEQWIRRAPVSA